MTGLDYLDKEYTNKNMSNAAITLIALIITIIILLILAGITLTMVMGDNGIIKKAQIAKEKTNEEQQLEEEKLNDIQNTLENYNITSRAGGKITIIYPNGTESEPAIITTDQRIEIDNPYPGHLVDCICQIKYKEYWGEPGIVYDAKTVRRLGCRCTSITWR